MPIGLIVNCLAVLSGGLLGCFVGGYLPEKTQKDLTVLMGFCSISIGITSIIKVVAMPPVIIAVVLGFAFGSVCNLEGRIVKLFEFVLKKLPLKQTENFSMDNYITVVILFCASGFGIYGVLVESISGNSGILLSKAVLDFFTAMIFAITLNIAVALTALPMIIIMLLIFTLGSFVSPFINDVMLMNFMACGGILTISAGLRVSGIKNIPIANLIPSLILVMPLTFLWEQLPI